LQPRSYHLPLDILLLLSTVLGKWLKDTTSFEQSSSGEKQPINGRRPTGATEGTHAWSLKQLNAEQPMQPALNSALATTGY
jgi:hypothetical protein